MNKNLILVLVFFLACPFLVEGKLYKYSELQTRSYDEMLKSVQTEIRRAKDIAKKNAKAAKAQNEEEEDVSDDAMDDVEAAIILKDALRMVLSRPDKDHMAYKLIPFVRSELNNFTDYNSVVDTITQEALAGLKQEDLDTVAKVTYLFVLENVMSEFKPELKSSEERNKEAAVKIFTQIRDADIELSKPVRTELKLRSMYRAVSPSETAKEVLKDFENSSKKK